MSQFPEMRPQIQTLIHPLETHRDYCRKLVGCVVLCVFTSTYVCQTSAVM